MDFFVRIYMRVCKKMVIYLGIKTGQYKIWTADCGLSIKYGLGIKRGLENMDWV